MQNSKIKMQNCGFGPSKTGFATFGPRLFYAKESIDISLFNEGACVKSVKQRIKSLFLPPPLQSGLVNWTFDATINEKCHVKKKSLFGRFEHLHQQSRQTTRAGRQFLNRPCAAKKPRLASPHCLGYKLGRFPQVFSQQRFIVKTKRRGRDSNPR
jgi:hypothetical protein